METRRMTTIAMLATVALIIYIIEAQIPPLTAIPGVKLGLANIVTLIAILLLDKKDAFIILLLRVVLGSIFAGQMMSFFYSLAGGLCCFAVMALLTTTGRDPGAAPGSRPGALIPVWAVSVCGAIAHNGGQLAVAAVVLGTSQIIWYAPVLLISGIVAGTFTGLCAQYLLRRLQNLGLS